jgi:glycosyltransferase involved in cell wall biosynthesis
LSDSTANWPRRGAEPPELRHDVASRPWRVVFVENNRDGTVGGSHHCLYSLVRNLDRHLVAPVVVFYQDNVFAERMRQIGVEVWLWDAIAPREFDPDRRPRHLMGKMAFQARTVRDRVRFLRRVRGSLVHLNNSPAAGLDDWLPASRWLGLPCIAHARATVGPDRGLVHRKLLPRLDRVIAVSQHVADTVNSAGFPADRLVLIYDGVDLADLRSQVRRAPGEVRAEFGIPDGAFLVVMVGHLRAWKGQHVLLQAAARLPADVRGRAVILLVGEAPPTDQAYLDHLLQLRQRLGLDRQVLLAGYRADAPELMSAADAVVHASTIPEPFGLVVVEAMALGRAVIASGIGGPAEVVLPGTGFLFDPEDPGALAERLARVAGDAELRSRLGDAARLRAGDFDIAPCVRATEAIYRDLLGPRAATLDLGA